MPVGFKNGTHGNIESAINGMYCAQHPHRSFGITKEGFAAIISSRGNDACHLVLRGNDRGANYSAETIAHVSDRLEKLHLNPGIIVDCSHGNSGKNYLRQKGVAADIGVQIGQGGETICGVMLESYLLAGRQAKPLNYGQSLTDSCLSFEETLPILESLARAVKTRRGKKGGILVTCSPCKESI
jgi:3-deoxy-7-phosphoheptulonate synthase